MDSNLPEQRFEGIGVSPGIARCVAVTRGPSFQEPERYTIRPEEVDNERERLENALVETRRQIVSLQNQLRGSAGAENASIFDAHLLVLEDHAVLQQVFGKVRDELVNVEVAFYSVFVHYMDTLRAVSDSYLRERALDLQDVARRVLRNLKPGVSADALSEAAVNHPHIILAPDLTPSDTASMDRNLVLGFATEQGSQTSHTAIMARSLNLPAVVGIHKLHELVHTGTDVLLDGYNGILFTNPSPETIAHYETYAAEKVVLRQSLEELVDKPAETKDDFRMILSCNIEFAHEIDQVKEIGGEGVGLFRTEFFYLNQVVLPDEAKLTEEYSRAVRESAPHAVIIRTLDIGGDKLPGSDVAAEPNPFLGWRGIRVSLGEPEMFQTQLRAILRASAIGKAAIMFPMISNLQELRDAKAQVEIAKDSLRNEGIAFDEGIQVGVMIEVPSAAMIADALAREADFFSIGTNDLVQYTIAVDRVNERVAGLYQPHHPAVLRLIKFTAEAAHQHGIWVGMCGEMAGDILSVPLLVGLGITELSVGASQVLAVKRAIRCLKKSECATLVEELTSADDPYEITARCREVAEAHFPELIT